MFWAGKARNPLRGTFYIAYSNLSAVVLASRPMYPVCLSITAVINQAIV